MSLPKQLSLNTLNKIVDRLKLVEVLGEDGDYFIKIRENKTLNLPFGAKEIEVIADIRIFRGGPIQDLIYAGIVVPGMVDSHMLFAFTPGDSAVPHFTLDSVGSFIPTKILAYHLDLVPRVDLGSNLEHLTNVFHPLTDTYTDTRSWEGMTPAHISPLQYALMSPWMLTHRCSDEAYAKLPESVDAYLNHWFSLVENGVKTDISSAQLLNRDLANRAAIFNIDVDPVWHRIIPLIGEEVAAQLLQILRTGYNPKSNDPSVVTSGVEAQAK